MSRLTPRSLLMHGLAAPSAWCAVAMIVGASTVNACAGEAPPQEQRPVPGDCTGDIGGVAGGGGAGGGGGAVAKPRAASQPIERRCPKDVIESPAEGDLDPQVFFDRLVHRYRGLSSYRDTIRMVSVTKRDGAEAARVETEIVCELRDGNLRVTTPTSQTRDALSLALPVRQSPMADQMRRDYEFWLAPHMTLKFDDDPLKHFRSGVSEGFTATDAEAVTIDNRTMVHLELRSGDGVSDDCAAKFDLFVNPETMLVECIAGQQRLPDGASSETSLHITPEETDAGEPTLMR